MKEKFAIILFTFIISVSPAFAAKPTPPAPTPYSICIDPGHGGSDLGSVNGSLQEKNINLDTAIILRNKLLASPSGYSVFMTRTTDATLSNADRYNFCNSQKAAILISIHHNGSSDLAIDYTTALYMKKSDVALAEIVSDRVSTALELTKKPISRFASGVLLKANMPSTISEGFFLTNTDEYNLLTANNDRLNQEADALLSAINTYFGK